MKERKKRKVFCKECNFKGEQMGFFDPIELYCKRTEIKVEPEGSCYNGEPIQKYR